MSGGANLPKVSTSMDEIKDLIANFTLGKRIECIVTAVSQSPASLDLSAVAARELFLKIPVFDNQLRLRRVLLYLSAYPKSPHNR